MQRHCRSCFSVLAFDPFVPCGFGNPLQLLFGAKTERRRSRFLRGTRGTVTLLPRRRCRQHRSRRFKRSGVQATRSSTTLACSWRRSCFLTDGSTFTWEYFQPAQLVQQVLDKCSGIARLYAEKLRDNPPSQDKPLRVVIGCDEHTPGSKVVSVNRRKKNMALVFNFVKLGPDIREM